MRKLFVATMAVALTLPVMANSTTTAPSTTTIMTAPTGSEIESTTTTTTKTLPQKMEQEVSPDETQLKAPDLIKPTITPDQRMEDEDEVDDEVNPNNQINDLDDEEVLDQAY